MRIILSILLIYLVIPFCLSAQTYTDEDVQIFNHYLHAMKSKKSLPTADLMVETARFFLARPYVGGTLEKEPECLVVNLRELDCTTLVETTIALVRTLRDEQPSFSTFCRYLQDARYRNGQINDYIDRLHYTTDWIFENERKGYVKDMTQAIGGKPLQISLSFMSTHPDSYLQLKNHPERNSHIAEKEREISGRLHYYIPEDEINNHASEIQQGDIVCFVTTVKGLDISHVGIVCREGEKLTFIHASSFKKQVIVNEESLQEYVQGIKRNSGIMIVRSQF